METPQEVLKVRSMFAKMEDDAAAALGPCPDGIAESWVDIHLPAADVPKGGEAWDSRAVIVHPTTPNSSAPLVVMLYGGGFQCGGIKQVLLPACAAALRYGAVVACPTYPLAPENKFPVPVQTAYRTVAWLSHPDNLYGIVPSLKTAGVVVDHSAGFVLKGFSAGANIAAAIAGVLAAPPETKSALLKGLPFLQSPLTGIHIGIPILTTEEIVPSEYAGLFTSRTENAESPSLPLPMVHRLIGQYAADVHSPWFSPFNLTSIVAANHPSKVFLQVNSEDCLRDDGIIYEKWLKAAGITDVRLKLLEGHDHAAWVSQVMSSPEQRVELKKVSLEGLAWLFGKDFDGNAGGVY